ncbi:MAG: UDP-glucose 4-epimerase, partial [archaeon]
LRAATTDRVGRAYNVGTGTETEIEALAETVRDVTGEDALIVHTDPRDGDVERSCADTSRARAELGFQANRGLEEGLDRLAKVRTQGSTQRPSA